MELSGGYSSWKNQQDGEKKPIRFSKRGDCQGAAGPEIRWRCEDDTQWKYHVDEIECVSFNLEGRGLWLSRGCRWPGPYFCWTRSKSVSLEELLGHGTLSRLPAVGNIHHRASDGLNLDWMPGWINVLFCDLVSFFFFIFSSWPDAAECPPGVLYGVRTSFLHHFRSCLSIKRKKRKKFQVDFHFKLWTL